MSSQYLRLKFELFFYMQLYSISGENWILNVFAGIHNRFAKDTPDKKIPFSTSEYMEMWIKLSRRISSHSIHSIARYLEEAIIDSG